MFIRVLSQTHGETVSLFLIPVIHRVLAASLGEKKRASAGYASVSRRGTRHHDTLSPLLYLNHELKKSRKQMGPLTRRCVVITCYTLLKNEKQPLSPVISLCRVSTVRRGELRTVRAEEKVANVLCWVNSAQCVTETQVTVGPEGFCAR